MGKRLLWRGVGDPKQVGETQFWDFCWNCWEMVHFSIMTFFFLFFVATERLGCKPEPSGGKSDTKREESVEEKRYMEIHWLVIHFD